MRQSAVRSTGPRAGTQCSLQSAPLSEQSGRSVPKGSRGRPFPPKFVGCEWREPV